MVPLSDQQTWIKEAGSKEEQTDGRIANKFNKAITKEEAHVGYSGSKKNCLKFLFPGHSVDTKTTKPLAKQPHSILTLSNGIDVMYLLGPGRWLPRGCWVEPPPTLRVGA